MLRSLKRAKCLGAWRREPGSGDLFAELATLYLRASQPK